MRAFIFTEATKCITSVVFVMLCSTSGHAQQQPTSISSFDSFKLECEFYYPDKRFNIDIDTVNSTVTVSLDNIAYPIKDYKTMRGGETDRFGKYRPITYIYVLEWERKVDGRPVPSRLILTDQKLGEWILQASYSPPNYNFAPKCLPR